MSCGTAYARYIAYALYIAPRLAASDTLQFALPDQPSRQPVRQSFSQSGRQSVSECPPRTSGAISKLKSIKELCWPVTLFITVLSRLVFVLGRWSQISETGGQSCPCLSHGTLMARRETDDGSRPTRLRAARDANEHRAARRYGEAGRGGARDHYIVAI